MISSIHVLIKKITIMYLSESVCQNSIIFYPLKLVVIVTLWWTDVLPWSGWRPSVMSSRRPSVMASRRPGNWFTYWFSICCGDLASSPLHFLLLISALFTYSWLWALNLDMTWDDLPVIHCLSSLTLRTGCCTASPGNTSNGQCLSIRAECCTLIQSDWSPRGGLIDRRQDTEIYIMCICGKCRVTWKISNFETEDEDDLCWTYHNALQVHSQRQCLDVVM